MDEFDKGEFWKALGRLYDDSLKTHENIQELRAGIHELRGVAADLVSATQNLNSVVESHERRLDRYEVTVEAILEELRRRREGDAR